MGQCIMCAIQIHMLFYILLSVLFISFIIDIDFCEGKNEERIVICRYVGSCSKAFTQNLLGPLAANAGSAARQLQQFSCQVQHQGCCEDSMRGMWESTHLQRCTQKKLSLHHQALAHWARTSSSDCSSWSRKLPSAKLSHIRVTRLENVMRCSVLLRDLS